MALLEEERETCDGCGQPRSVSMDPTNMRTWRVHSHRCEACALIEAKAENDADSGQRYGMKYAVSRTTSGG